MVEIFKHWLFVLLLGAMAVAANPAQAEPTIPLTAEETAWLKAHPTIRIGVDPDFPPFEFIISCPTCGWQSVQLRITIQPSRLCVPTVLPVAGVQPRRARGSQRPLSVYYPCGLGDESLAGR